MFKKIILVSIAIIFFSEYHLAQADVVINEVQLFPTEERFLELYNTDGEAVDLTGWYMQRKTATGSSFGSLVSNPNFEGKTISADGYFVISRNSISNSDIVLDTLTLTESNTIQIKNSNGEVVYKVGWGDTSDCDSPCPPNPSEGRSIQKTENGSWITATSTPGEENKTSSSSSGSDDSDNDSDDDGEDQSTTSASNSNKETNTKTTTSSKVKAQIVVSKLAYVGIPLTFQGMAFGSSGEKLFHGRYFWNFGDGDFREVKVVNTDKFTHTYFYPGDYNVLFEYYPDNFADTPDVSAQVTIKVVTPTISISSVGNEVDFFIELSNDTEHAVDLSNWFLISDQKSFPIPRNTILASKKKMIVSSRVSNFSLTDKNTLKLITPQGELVSDYSDPVVPIAIVPVKTIVQPKESFLTVEPTKMVAPVPEEEISVPESLSLNESNENLLASAVSSDNQKDNSIRTYFLAFILTIFIGVSAGAVYLIRQKRTLYSSGDDFKILDE